MLSSNASPAQSTGAESSNFLDYLEAAYNSKTFLVIQIIIGLYCLILIFNIAYTSFQLSLFRGRARQLLTGVKAKPEQYDPSKDLPGATHLLEINKKLTSQSPSDWKIAIIEADKTFDKLLEKRGFMGESLGGKLKDMVPNDLPELYEEVWEAHKIRNRIVHEPEFEISQSEARKVVGIFERAIRKML